MIDDDTLDTISNKKSKQKDKKAVLDELKREMNAAAKRMDFEQAAKLRDLIFELEK